MALEDLGIEVDHQFSCDNNAAVKKLILANFKPAIFYDDVATRNHTDASVPKDLDLYVAGFPCQTFSAQGKNAGTRDPRGRIVGYVIRYIDVGRPKAFVLENVKGILMKRHRATLQNILRPTEPPKHTHCHSQHLHTLPIAVSLLAASRTCSAQVPQGGRQRRL
jgi:site-specific DNA-cytosine methylase